MASGIQRDTVSWLNSKLESPWTSERVVAHLSNPMLHSFAEKFSSLDTGIKLRILFSFLSLRKKNLEDLREGIREVIDIAKTDEDDWVKVCAQLLSSINESKQKVAIDSLENTEIHSTIEQLKSSLTAAGPIQYCPMEYAYLSSKVLPTLPTSLTSNSHFHVKQKMTITIKKDTTAAPKKRTDDIDAETLPEAPSPSVAPRNKGPPSSGLGMKKGIQMQRKKMQVIDIREVEELKKKQEDEKEAKKKKAPAEEKLDTVKVGVPIADPEKKRKKKDEDMLKPKPLKKETPKKLKSGEPLPITPTVQPAMVGATITSPTAAARPIIVSTGSPQVTPQPLGINPISPFKAAPTAPVADTSASSLLSQALGQSPQAPKLVHSVYSPMSQPMKPTSLSPMVSPQATTPAMLKPNPTPPARTPSPAPPTTPAAPATPTQPGQTIVTPDSLLENANSLSAEDRQVVLRFLMGDRTNPNPAQGNIHQILLNFETKVNPQNGGLYQEQLIFEMNYETGTWRKLRRKKTLQKEEGAVPPNPTVQ